MNDLLIGTWFVQDEPGEGTYFPQIGGQSTDAGAKAVYWRCILTFYATSLAVNPHRPHAFFTNTDLPSVDGVNVGAMLSRWDVEVVRLPITFRIPLGRVDSWGNQFYIFDIINYCAETERWRAAVILDSDVVWTESADKIEQRVHREGLVSYANDLNIAYPPNAEINGVTRQQLARFMASHGGPDRLTVVYCGGEIFCATLSSMKAIAARVDPLWQSILVGDADAPKEEAHLLSLIYAMEGMPIGNGGDVVKRMWTTFRHRNIDEADLFLPIWHLPSEKLTGFSDLFQWLDRAGWRGKTPSQLGIDRALLARIFGIPRRSSAKFVRDLSFKLREKASKLASHSSRPRPARPDSGTRA